MHHTDLQELEAQHNTEGGWSVGKHLLDPPIRRGYQERDESMMCFWIVLIESDSGCHILFDDSERRFGLSAAGIVVEWHVPV